MKRLINLLSILALIVVAIACSGEKKADEAATDGESKTVKVFTIREIYDAGTELEGKTIFVAGNIDHVCRHSKKRCTIVDMDGKFSMKIDFAEEVPAFDSDVAGRMLSVEGKLVPTRMNLEEVKVWKEQTIAHHKGMEEDEHYKEEMIYIDGIIQKMEAGEMKQYTNYAFEEERYTIMPEKD